MCKWWTIGMPLIQCPYLLPLDTSVSHFQLQAHTRSHCQKRPRNSASGSKLPAADRRQRRQLYPTSLTFKRDKFKLHILYCFLVPWVGVSTFVMLIFIFLIFLLCLTFPLLPVFSGIIAHINHLYSNLHPSSSCVKSEWKYISRFATKLTSHWHQTAHIHRPLYGPGKCPRNVFT